MNTFTVGLCVSKNNLHLYSINRYNFEIKFWRCLSNKSFSCRGCEWIQYVRHNKLVIFYGKIMQLDDDDNDDDDTV